VRIRIEFLEWQSKPKTLPVLEYDIAFRRGDAGRAIATFLAPVVAFRIAEMCDLLPNVEEVDSTLGGSAPSRINRRLIVVGSRSRSTGDHASSNGV
jgi:hypothetical protein